MDALVPTVHNLNSEATQIESIAADISSNSLKLHRSNCLICFCPLDGLGRSHEMAMWTRQVKAIYRFGNCSNCGCFYGPTVAFRVATGWDAMDHHFASSWLKSLSNKLESLAAWSWVAERCLVADPFERCDRCEIKTFKQT